MKRFRALFLSLAGATLALVLLAGCKGGGVTPIKTLLDDPGRFDHQTVRIAGTVGESVGVLGYGAFQLDDGTGMIAVVSKEGGAPRQGAKVGVEGEFGAAFTLGPRTAAAVVEKQRFTP